MKKLIFASALVISFSSYSYNPYEITTKCSEINNKKMTVVDGINAASFELAIRRKAMYTETLWNLPKNDRDIKNENGSQNSIINKIAKTCKMNPRKPIREAIAEAMPWVYDY